MKAHRMLAPAFLALALAACQGTSSQTPPVPVVMTDEALGHYCQMYLNDHGGPKAQIHLKNIPDPIWFAQVSDAIAYLHDPDQIAEITAIYVTDMSKAPSWAEVGNDNWTEAKTAFYVIESRQMGGMGTPEAVPFSTREAADAFAISEGGRVTALEDIEDAYVRPQS